MTTLRGDFSPQADAYARARPPYPPAIVDRLLERAGVNQADHVVDLGAGTGLLTEQLCTHCLHVSAVEPNAAMRDRNIAPGATWLAGSFEETGLADCSQDWAVAAQAFHWADPPRALAETRRVLRPGAKLSVLWNQRDIERSATLAHAHRLIQTMAPGFDEGYADRDWGPVLTSTGHFVDPKLDELDHVVPMTRDRFDDLWRSHNLLNAAVGTEGVAQLLLMLDDVIDADEVIAIPYRCRAFTVTRKA